MQRHNRILMVDDHPTNIAILEEILGNDYPLQTATCGEEALALAPDFQPALILLDIMMPGIGGYETCRRLRAHPTLRHTKILMVSAKAMVAERLQGYEAGADEYITKPFDEEELAAKVRVYLRLKSLEEVEQLTSNVLTLLSHETRTPLNGLLAPLQMLREEAEMTAEDRAMLLDMVCESAAALHGLIEKVNRLSAMQAGQWNFQYTLEDLSTVVQGAVDTATADAAAHDVTITPELLAPTLITMDPPQMHRVVMALLANAIRFSPGGGRVAVRVMRANGQVCLCVTDQGPGIAPDVLPRLFEPFTAGDLSHHSTGHGLSLAIARQIVWAHDGTIEVESTPSVATTFTMRLPEAAGCSQCHAPGTCGGAGPPGAMRFV
ncbi:MAG TPA: hybrid sensor histidine kinase/response regulator [Candidatus Tectomicrobia bacterium]